GGIESLAEAAMEVLDAGRFDPEIGDWRAPGRRVFEGFDAGNEGGERLGADDTGADFAGETAGLAAAEAFDDERVAVPGRGVEAVRCQPTGETRNFGGNGGVKAVHGTQM
ncbi:MAG: hypothetical protein ACI8U4_002417, partial [Natronomonas sp.]